MSEKLDFDRDWPLSPVGRYAEELLFNRLPKDGEGRTQYDHKELSDDEIIMLRALSAIRFLRVRDPETIEAERIIREAAACLSKELAN